MFFTIAWRRLSSRHEERCVRFHLFPLILVSPRRAFNRLVEESSRFRRRLAAIEQASASFLPPPVLRVH